MVFFKVSLLTSAATIPLSLESSLSLRGGWDIGKRLDPLGLSKPFSTQVHNSIQYREAFLQLIQTPDLPDLGPTPRASRLPLGELSDKVDGFIQETKLSPALQPVVRCAALLWHDYLDESHAISQNMHNADGSFLHAIMHRREPDYSNAKYWFQRVGPHPCFSEIARQVIRLLETSKEMAAKLAPRSNWDPFAFVDACEAAARRPSADTTAQTLRAIQGIEFNGLLSHVFSGIAPNWSGADSPN